MSKRNKSKTRSVQSQNKIVYTLQSGRTVNQDELDEIHLLDDIQNIKIVLDNGFSSCDLPFGDVPLCCIPEIAKRKAVLERQKGYSWIDASEKAIHEWNKKELQQLRELLCTPQAANEEPPPTLL